MGHSLRHWLIIEGDRIGEWGTCRGTCNSSEGVSVDTRTRLDSISSDLAELFRHSSELRQRWAVLAACVLAVAQSGLESDDLDVAFEFLRGGHGDKLAVRVKLRKLSEQLDEQYLNLYLAAEEEMTPGALSHFRRARAASALSFGLSSSTDELHESIYEAIVASETRAETLNAAELALKEQPLNSRKEQP